MADETRSVELAIDNSKAIKALEDLRKKEVDIAKAQAKGTLTANDAAKAIAKVEKERRDLIKINRVLDDSFGRTTKAVKEETQAISELDQRLKDLDETSSRQRQQIGIAGDVGSAGRTLGGAAGAFGGEGAERAISTLAELPDSLEALGQLKPALAGLPAVTRKVADGLGTSTAALGGLAVGTIALGIALAVGKKAAEESRAALTNLLEAEKRRNEIIHEGQQLTNDELDAKIADIAAQRELAQAENDRNQALVEGLENTNVGIRAIGELSSAIGVGNQAFAVARDAAKESQAELNRLSGEEQILIGVRENGGNEASELAAREAELATQRDELVQSSDRALQASEQASEQLNSALADRAQSQADAAQLSALEAKFAAEDQVAQEKEHRTNLSNIATQGQARLESLQEGFGALATERNKSLQGIETKGSDKINKARGAFFSKQISATRKFQSDTAKIETDTAKKRTKLLADLNDRLSDASRDNNVIAFLEAQREGNKALAEDAINAQDAEKQRIQEFTQQREQERQIFEQKQAETLAAIEAEKIKVIEAFGERQIALAKQIDAEKIAIEQRIALEEKRFADQEAREAQQTERTRRRAELRQRQEERDFNARMSALRQESDRRQQIHQQEMSALSAIQTQIAQLQAAASRPASGGTSGRRFGGSQSSPFINSASRFGQRRPNSSSSSSRIQPFHDGGVIDFASGQSEGFALVKAGEIVLNPDTLAKKGGSGLPLSGGSASGVGSSSMQVTIQDNRTLQIGDIATVAAVSSAIDRSNKAMVNNIHKMVEGATA